MAIMEQDDRGVRECMIEGDEIRHRPADVAIIPTGCFPPSTAADEALDIIIAIVSEASVTLADV